MKIILIGVQGAGKSTQGNLLSEQLKTPYLSTGHIFREMAKEKTKLGRYVKETINAGLLIPDDKVILIIREYLSKPEYAKGYILDGFPRTLRQAKSFKDDVDKVIYLKISDKEALWRLAYRNGVIRGDETIKAVRKRIEAFHRFTGRVIDFYAKKGKLVTIDGSKGIKEVNRQILKTIGKRLIENKIHRWERKHKSIIALVGLPGAGKSEAAAYLKNKGLPLISFGRIINEALDKQGLPQIEANHKKMREGLRKKYGLDAFAKLNEKKIAQALEKNPIVVIDGLRSWEEYLYLKKAFKGVKIYLVALYANKELRYQRTRRRKKRTKLYGKERDVNELIGTNMGPTIAFADYLIKNNLSKENLFNELENIYRIVYFS